MTKIDSSNEGQYKKITLNYSQLTKVALSAAQQGGRILKKHFGRIHQISEKKDAGLVTEVDRRSEKKIIQLIHKSFPDHGIIGEEGGEIAGRSPIKWIIDPLDGTTNYAHGLPFFCVSIGVQVEEEICVGVVYDPLRDDLYWTEKGKDSYKNRKKLRVSRTKKVHDSLIGTGFSYLKQPVIDLELKNLKAIVVNSRGVRRTGSAAWDLCQVACGIYDGFWERHLQVWDVAGAYLIIKNSGGTITRIDGSPWHLYDSDVLATNSLIHDEMINLLKL